MPRRDADGAGPPAPFDVDALKTSTNVIVKAELFPAGVRALGTGLPFGGSADYIAFWFRSIGHASWFFWYVTACILVSLAVYIFMRETRDCSRFDA